MTNAESGLPTPTVTVRKSELDEVKAILEDDSYESADKMARALLKATFGMLLARDWWIVGSPGPRGRIGDNDERTPAGIPILYGPFPTDGAAVKALKDERLGLTGTVGIFKVNSPTKQGEKLDAVFVGGSKKDCARCKHNRESHDWPRPRIVGCVAKGCGCQKYIAP